MISLTDFLLARISEDEALARQTPLTEFQIKSASAGVSNLITRQAVRWSPRRVLAECEAKRRIVHRAEGNHMEAPADYTYLALLATVYAGRPDYRKEWVV